MRLKRQTVAAMVVAALLCTPLMSVAQEDATGGGVSLTGHWAFRFTQLYEDGAQLTGGGLGITLGARNRLELVGFGTASPSVYGSLEFHMAYAGVRLERELWRRGRVGASAALRGGGGTFWTKERQTDVEERTGIGLVEPEVVLGFDLGTHAQFALTGSYRWVRGVEGDILNRSDGDARGFAAGLRLAVK
jgi:nitrogen fixation protein